MNKSCVSNTLLESWGGAKKEKKGTEAKTYLLASNVYLFLTKKEKSCIVQTLPFFTGRVVGARCLTPFLRTEGSLGNSGSGGDREVGRGWPRLTFTGMIASRPPELGFSGLLTSGALPRWSELCV